MYVRSSPLDEFWIDGSDFTTSREGVWVSGTYLCWNTGGGTTGHRAEGWEGGGVSYREIGEIWLSRGSSTIFYKDEYGDVRYFSPSYDWWEVSPKSGWGHD
jgi:hypothetical protein